jgi:CRP/FNR family transcriptional regulator, cyclic AMP receptor protein
LTSGDSSPFPIIEIDDVSTFYANLTVEQFKVAKKVRVVNPAPFLSTSGKGRSMLSFPKKSTTFAQGDASDGLFVIQQGRVRLSIKSEGGKSATVAILGEDDFFGEGGLAGQPVRILSATAVTDCVLLHIKKQTMMLAMNREPKVAVTFVKYLLKRIIRDQDNLVDQLFNVSEKRLARVLWSMAQFDDKGKAFDLPIPRLSQATLAEMVGTTRSRVSYFMNKFRELGFIGYDGSDDLRIPRSLFSVVQNGGIGTMTPKALPKSSARRSARA